MANTALRGIRQAIRALRRERAFSVTVITTLAVVIAANVAIFSIIRAVLLAPLPYDEPDRLVSIYNSYPGAGVERASNGTFDFVSRRERIDAFEEIALVDGYGNTVGDPGSTERVSTLRVTPSLFPLLRVNAALGRTFGEETMEPGQEFEVVLSHSYWMDRFAGDPEVVGQDLRIDGRPYSIVGVMPEDFRVVGDEDARFFIPIPFSQEARSIESWHSNSFGMFGRLAPGATIERARAEIGSLNEALTEEFPMPNARQLLDDIGFQTYVVPVADDLLGDVRPTLFMLWAGVGFVLLIGCVNIANLMLGRAQNRLGEVATRLALGAPRRKVAMQIVVESLVLALIGGVLGLAGGFAALRLLTGLGIDRLPRGVDIRIDGTVVAFTVVLTVLTALIFALAPVLQVLGRELNSVFRSEGRSTTAGRGSVLLRNGLVVGQVALAFVLLIGAGLMLMSFRAALAIDPGFNTEELGTGMLSLPVSRYEDSAQRLAFVDGLLRDLESQPGLERATITSQLPFSGNNSSSVILPEAYTPPPGESIVSPFVSLVGPDYFRTMGIPLIEGRDIEWNDGPEQTPVIVIDRALANRYWPDRSPLGFRMANVVPGEEVEEEDYYTIVGVVENIKQNDLTASDADHVGAYYLSARQSTPNYFSLVTRGREGGDVEALTPALREAINRMDPEIPLADVRTMEQRIDLSLQSRRAPMTLLLVFAGVALFLAVIGIYGTLAYSVARRGQEMGIRMALGGAASDIFALVLRYGASVVGIGLVLGLLASVALSRIIRSLLFGVQPLDPVVLLSVMLVLGTAGIAACVIPARRATRIDPMRALAPE